MTTLSAGRTPIAVFAFSVLASACGAVAAQTVPVSTMLPPVLVTATRFAKDANSLPFGVSVITAEEMRDAGVSTVNEALMKLLGIPGKLDFYGGGDYGVDLRGFGSTAGSNQVVIVDGVRVSEADLGGTRLAGISIDSIDRIEVIRGSAAVLYGEGATGGAIVITTKAASGKAVSGAQAYAALGSQSLAEARAGGTIVNGGFSLDVAGNRRTTDGHRENFRSSIEGLALTAQWRNDWLRVGGQHTQDELHTGLPGALTTAQYEANPRQTNRPNDRGDIDNHRNNLFAEATLGDWQIAVDAGQRDKTLLSLSSFAYDYDIDARNRSARVKHSTTFGGYANTVVAGVDHNEWNRVVRGAFGSTSEQKNKAVYLQEDFKLPVGMRLSAGVRKERVTKTDTSVTTGVDESFTAWNVGVVQPLGDSASVFAHLGRSFRFPNVDEIGFAQPGGLRVQTSRDLDLGGRWAYDDNGRAELRLYRNALRDEIGYDPAGNGPFGPFGANINFDGATLRQGIELELAHRLNRAVQLRLNATARQARFTGGTYDGNDIALVPKRTVSFGADWKVGGGHQLNGLVNMVSSQSPDFANRCSMPSYTTADARYAYRQGDVQLSLGVANLTDKKYYTQAFRCVGGTTSSIYPEAGRSVVASLRVGF
ncbi:MAG: TonB-dependent receptor [Rhizobacter sp.]|nr:TonB-dependent receptor [Rhizobacter sp.]